MGVQALRTEAIDVEVTGDSTLELFPLRVKRDADEFIVGRPASGAYLALSAGALAAAELLLDGRTVADTKAALARADAGRPVRMRPLLETLLAAGLVKAVDGAPLAETRAPRRYHLTFLRRRHVAWAFSRPAVAAYASLLGAGLAIVVAEPRYLPRPADALVAPGPVINLALLWCVSMLAMAMHELAHLLAATFLGVQASFALGYRLYFPVAQTDLTDLWLVDKSKRYLAYAAGMVNDLVWASAAVTALWLHDQHLLPLPGLLYRMLRLAVLVLVFGVLWQLNVYLRTDVYYLIANVTGCRNLSRDATRYVKTKLARWLTGAAPAVPVGVPSKEMRVVRAFAVLMVVGTTGAFAVGAVYLGAVVLFLLGSSAPLRGEGLSPRQAAPFGPFPVLASLGITGCWLAVAFIARRRRRPRVRYRLRCPEDL